MLGYLAARTERLRLGTGVVVLPLHNPIHVPSRPPSWTCCRTDDSISASAVDIRVSNSTASG